MEKIFYVPWESEDVCSWCKKRSSDCRGRKQFRKVLRAPAVFEGEPVYITYAQMRYCTTGEFEADEKQLPEQFKDHKIKQRDEKDEPGVIDIKSRVRYGRVIPQRLDIGKNEKKSV